jgi:hypothetical protein
VEIEDLRFKIYPSPHLDRSSQLVKAWLRKLSISNLQSSMQGFRIEGLGFRVKTKPQIDVRNPGLMKRGAG